MLARQNINRRAALEEVEHHLRCDRTWIGGDAMLGETMIGSKHPNLRLLDTRPSAALNHANL